MKETEIRLAEELSQVCHDYCDVTWDKALTAIGVPADSTLRLPGNIYYHPQNREIPSVSSPLAPGPESFQQPLAIPDASLLLKFQRNPARLVIKARGLREKKARTRTKGRSHLPRPKMLPKCRKQRPESKRSIPRPRMLSALSQARRRTLLLKHSP